MPVNVTGEAGRGTSSTQRTLGVGVVMALCAVLVLGCGDVFRPTINFQPQPGGQPANPGQAVVLSTNPSGDGSDTHIDVSGDSNLGVVNAGPNPVFVGKEGARAFVLNGDNTVSLYTALSAQGATVSQVILPASTSGAIGGAASSNGNLYIANQGPCVTVPASTNGCVSVIAAGGNVVNQTIPVGTRPVMVATNANGAKAYVINHDDSTVTIIGTQDNSIIGTIKVGAQPIWGVMSNDGIDVFIVNQGDGTVSVIDTTLDIVFTTINLNGTGTSNALQSNFAFYDNVRKRVYVTNPGDKSVTVIKADSINLGATPQILPIFLAKVALSGSPLSVGAIADGTRAYAALANCPAGTNHTNLVANLAGCTGNQVSVIDAVAFIEKTVIPVGSGAVSLAPSVDGTRVYVTNAHDGTISIIKTSTDAELMRLAAPLQSVGCVNPASCPGSGTQTPFMVLTFP